MVLNTPQIEQFMLRSLKKINTLSDEELINSYKKNPRSSLLNVLLNRHLHKLYGVCLNYLKNQADAEDAVMDICSDLPQKFLAYDIQKFDGWLFLIARNHCLKLLKERAKLRIEWIDEINEDHFVENGQDDTLNIEELRLEVLSDAINQLKDHQKRCIILFYLEHKSYKEIEEMTSYSANEVKSHIQNGKKNLKKIILKLT